LRLRFYLDPSGEPHIYGHNVTEAEVEQVLAAPLETIRGKGTSRVVIGQTRSGRYLKVIYSLDDDNEGAFVVTAFDLPWKQVHALKRRLGRKRR
jgi:hypothetical protein